MAAKENENTESENEAFEEELKYFALENIPDLNQKEDARDFESQDDEVYDDGDESTTNATNPEEIEDVIEEPKLMIDEPKNFGRDKDYNKTINDTNATSANDPNATAANNTNVTVTEKAKDLLKNASMAVSRLFNILNHVERPSLKFVSYTATFVLVLILALRIIAN